jgi:hypothetical protein
MRTGNGPFLLPKPGVPRLTVRGWTSGRGAIYNADYAANGDKFLTLDKPWTVLTPCDFRAFHTYAEAATYAFKGMTK